MTQDNHDAMPCRLKGRIALITGGSRGQGAAHARRLAQEGAHVLAVDILDDEGTALARTLQAENLDVTYRHLDVTRKDEWTALHDHLADIHGKLDILVNNAGIVHISTIEDETPETWQHILNVNLSGAFLGLQSMIPLLRKSGHASVINTSSIFGPSGAPGYSAYATSKAGLLGFSRTAALELAADGIRVNALVPGGVSTPLNAAEKEGGVIPETPLRRRATPQELSAAVAFLASDDASFMTGAELVVDGGFSAR
ncbi:MAG: SDR family oxidoreductase [Acetobacter sp.]|uniref:SDR family NAD(P)-dependent oxidoreductase n=1 Tax=Acetobacter sp. TaxID=440 RepID=UPI0039EC9218